MNTEPSPSGAGDSAPAPGATRTLSIVIGLTAFVGWVVLAVFILYGISLVVETRSWLGFPGLLFIMVGGALTFFGVTRLVDRWLARRR